MLTCFQFIAWFFMSESPRWLLIKQKHQKFLNMVLMAAKENKNELKTSTLLSLEYYNDYVEENLEATPKLKYSSLFERPQIILTITMMTLWPITAMGYYGISLSMSGIGVNAYWSNALSALLEIPSYFILTALMDRTGRRPLLVFSLLFTSLTCLGAAISTNQVRKSHIKIKYLYICRLCKLHLH